VNCPACLSQLTPLNYGRIELDTCPECSGLWFDQGELKQVSAMMDDRARGLPLDPWEQVRKMSVKVGKRKCPRCQAPLGVVCYPHPKVEVDVCLLCAGVWLDSDELNKILQYVDEQMSPRTAPVEPRPVEPEPAPAPARNLGNALGFVKQSVWDNMPQIRERGRE